MLSNSSSSSLSLTGSWGTEKFSARLPKEGYDTTYKSTFNGESINTLRLEKTNEFAKFKTLKATGMASLGRNYSGPNLDPPEAPGVLPLNSVASMERTRYLRNRSIEAPIAVGRSGVRKEKGTSTSGLLGERLQLDPEPRINSLVQRSWMYAPDPALTYKINGVPKAAMPNDVSLAIGYDPNVVPMNNRSNETEKMAWSWNHQRKSNITAHPTSRCIGDGIHIFMDEKYAPAVPETK